MQGKSRRYMISSIVLIGLVILTVWLAIFSENSSQVLSENTSLKPTSPPIVISDSVTGLKIVLPQTWSITHFSDHAKNWGWDAEEIGSLSHHQTNNIKLITELVNQEETIEVIVKRSSLPLDKDQCLQTYPNLSYENSDGEGKPIFSAIIVGGYPFEIATGDDSGMMHQRDSSIYRGVVNNYCVLIDVNSDFSVGTELQDKQVKEKQAEFDKMLKEVNQWVQQFSFISNS